MRPIVAMLAAAAVLASSGGRTVVAGADDGSPPASSGPAPGLVLPPAVTDGFIASGGSGRQAVQPPLAVPQPPQQQPAKPGPRRESESFWPNIRLHGSFGFGR